MTSWAASGNNANAGGAFEAADACDALLERTRQRVADAARGVGRRRSCFGANMTTLTLAFTRAVAADAAPRRPRRRHPARPRRQRDAVAPGVRHRPAPSTCSPRSTRRPARSTRRPSSTSSTSARAWVTLPGASNLLGTVPDLAPIIAAAHDAGAARVRRRRAPRAAPTRSTCRRSAATSSPRRPYKWYGPHAGVLCADPALLDELPVAKVRPAPDRGPRRWETGTPSFEAIAAVEAAAAVPARRGPRPHRRGRGEGVRARCSRGCWRCPACGCGDRRRWRAARRRSRSRSTATAPTTSPRRSPPARIATWAGHSYARGGRRPARARRLRRRRARRRRRLHRRRRRQPASLDRGPSHCALADRSDGRSGPATAASMRARTSASRRWNDVQRAEVLDDLAGLAGPGDHGRHVRVLRCTTPAPAGPSSSRARRRSAAAARPWPACAASDSRDASQP